jgi:signal transduction histidine kinase
MGLSISRSIIEAHEGRLTISSDGKSGATVQITLPSHERAQVDETRSRPSDAVSA